MLNPMVTPARSEYVRLVMRVLIVTQKDLTHFPWVTPQVPIVLFKYLTAFFRFGRCANMKLPNQALNFLVLAKKSIVYG